MWEYTYTRTQGKVKKILVSLGFSRAQQFRGVDRCFFIVGFDVKDFDVFLRKKIDDLECSVVYIDA